MACKTAADSSLLIKGTLGFIGTKIGGCDFQREFRSDDRAPFPNPIPGWPGRTAVNGQASYHCSDVFFR